MQIILKRNYSTLLEEYEKRKHAIKRRLKDFQTFYHKPVVWEYKNKIMHLIPSAKTDDERLFEELSFCILTANGTAETGMNCINKIRDILMKATSRKIQKRLIGSCRFHNRAEYIVHNREFLKKKYNFKLKQLIEKFNNKQELRDFLVVNIKGFGYKESSHFLRNIGFKGYAILDMHIISSMKEFSIISNIPKTITPRKYLELEQSYLNWAKEIGIDSDELDLLLWGRRTGRILK